MRTGLFDIPQELRIQILSHLDAISLTRCAFTCKSLYDTFRTTSQLQYIIQLHFEGLTDAGVSTDYAELIQHLQRRRKAWSCPHAIEQDEPFALNVYHLCQAYELVGGAFAHANREFFEIVRLPTARNPEPRTLRRAAESTGIRIRDFAMDPTQDVIALLEGGPSPLVAEPRIDVRVHIHAISTDAVHPRAQRSPLELAIAPRRNRGGAPLHHAFMQFARNTLVLYFCTHVRMQPYIQIWDWTTGEVISDCSRIFDPSIPRQFQFGLLDPTSCFVTSTTADSGEIRLYALVRSPTSTPRPAIPLAILYLPPTAAGTDIIAIDAHTAPIEAHLLPGAPCVQNDGDRLHVFTVQYIMRTEEESTHVFANLFVHQRVFLAYAQRHARGAPLEVPWGEWGPRNTRLMYPARVEQQHWMRYVHGQRVVCPQTSRDVYFGDDAGAGPSTVEILDFSRAAVLAAQQKLPPTPPALDTTPKPGGVLPTANPGTSTGATTDTSTALSTSSTISARDVGIFEEDVQTHLPCVVTEWRVRRRYGAYMIHGEGIVGVNWVCVGDGMGMGWDGMERMAIVACGGVDQYIYRRICTYRF